MTPINNVVDISNYVLMECGQPLHTFDFAKLKGREIIVRRPLPGETIEAIDHKTYALAPGHVHDCRRRRPGGHRRRDGRGGDRGCRTTRPTC